jgi:hypothetical protein
VEFGQCSSGSLVSLETGGLLAALTAEHGFFCGPTGLAEVGYWARQPTSCHGSCSSDTLGLARLPIGNSGDTHPISRACRHLHSGRTGRGSNAVLLDTCAPSNGLIFRLSTLGIDDSGRLGVIVSR